MRFSAATDRAVQEEARRLRRSKSAIVESLTEEAMRTGQFPGIAFRGEDAGRRPWAIGTGLDIWEICHMIEDFESIEDVVGNSQLEERLPDLDAFAPAVRRDRPGRRTVARRDL